MQTIEINGVAFQTEKDKSYFLKNRSPRLDKKFYTGRHLTLILSVRIMMTTEHYKKIVEKARSLDSSLIDIDDYILSLSYEGDDFEFKKSRKDHYLGIMGCNFTDEYFSLISAWEIHAPDQITFNKNRKSLLSKLSSYLEIDNVKTFDTSFYDEIESDEDDEVFPWTGENIIAYSTKNIHVLD